MEAEKIPTPMNNAEWIANRIMTVEKEIGRLNKDLLERRLQHNY